MNNETKCTPGPWKVEPAKMGDELDPRFCHAVTGGDWIKFALIVTKMEDENHPSATGILNARLISAAPELLSSLIETTRMLEAAHRQIGMYSVYNPRIVAAHAAIKKATGAA